MKLPIKERKKKKKKKVQNHSSVVLKLCRQDEYVKLKTENERQSVTTQEDITQENEEEFYITTRFNP